MQRSRRQNADALGEIHLRVAFLDQDLFQIKRRLSRLLPRLRHIGRGGQALFETLFRRLLNFQGRIQRRLRDINAAANLGQFVKSALHLEDDFLMTRIETEVGGEQLFFAAFTPALRRPKSSSTHSSSTTGCAS